MKNIFTFLIISVGLILLSCSDNDPISSRPQSENLDKLSLLADTQFNVSKIIDGTIGGEIVFDTIIFDCDGNAVSVSASLTFEANSFTGSKIITVFPDVETGSIRFYPEMIFNSPAKLDLSFTGINLKKLGFSSNSKVDFVYISDDGVIQYILKNECKIKWDKQLLYVKKAELPHFSRYGFVK